MPLVRWDGTHLVLSTSSLEALAREKLADGHLRSIRFVGAGDGVGVRVELLVKGVATTVEIRLTEIRLRRRFLGFRLRRVGVLGGLPVPRALVRALVGRFAGELVTVVDGSGVFVVDLREWIPPEVELSILTVQATPRAIHVWLGGGELSMLPGRRRHLEAGAPPGLAAGSS